MPELISPWLEIRDHFTGGGLVLGNGASIAFDQRFRYDSLFANARESGRLAEVAEVFRRFDTEDFERVLRALWVAQSVNDALGLATGQIGAHYERVRTALIETVRAIHPAYAEVENRLPRAAAFMRNFRTVASLSYDALIYWSLLVGNDQRGSHRFKDAFLHGTFDSHWQRFRTPHGEGVETVTLVCYPHGHLALAREWANGNVRKLAAGNGLLLETIYAEWQIRHVTPLFVSEGAAQQKRDAIATSPYLTVVQREMLPDLACHEDLRTRTVVALGWSFGVQDEHLLAALGSERLNRLAVGINPEHDADQVDAEQQRIRGVARRHLLRADGQLEWFDYRSPGCWLAPEEPIVP